MLDTALRQIRYGLAAVTGGRPRVDDARHIAETMARTWAEYGGLDLEKLREMQAAGVEADVRKVSDSRRWRRTVQHAYEHTAYYRHALDSRGLSPDDLTLDRRAELPPTPKSAMRNCPEAFLSDTARPVFQAWTTGTTGTPTAFWFSRYELELGAAMAASSMMVGSEIDPTDVIAICISSRAVLGLNNTMSAARLIGAPCFLIGTVDEAETLSRLATPVHLPGARTRPSVITITASHLAALVQAAAELGYTAADFGLRRIFSAGELLSEALRTRAEETFGAEVQDFYAMTELFPVGAQVCTARHLHMAADQGLVEVLDPATWAPTPPGGEGTLVVTPFTPYRETMPVLRLATGDVVRTLDAEPACELRAFPATTPILGRVGAPVAADGRVLHHRDVLELLEAEPAVPLPCRWAAVPADDGAELHVLARRDQLELQARLEGQAQERRLPVSKVVLHTDLATMPPTQFIRSLLRETTVTRDEEAGTWRLV